MVVRVRCLWNGKSPTTFRSKRFGVSLEEGYLIKYDFQILKGAYEPINARYSNDLALVIEKCLKVNPKERSTVEELLELHELQ
jgi:hypothetical protein